MVNYKPESLDLVFGALSDPTRRRMVARLSEGPASVAELGEPFDITKPAVTKHVKVLERAGLLERRKDGRIHRCSLNPEPMQDAERWIEEYRRFWEASLGRLSRYFDESAGTEKEKE